MELLRELVRARALESLLAGKVTDPGLPAPEPRPVSPAVPAARALRRASDGSGDVFTLRVGSPAAALSMGIDPRDILRQDLGRRDAPAEGRDGGGFATDLDRGLLSPFALPGTLVEVLSGIALAFKLRGEPRVALLVDDVGGTASGDWHEGLNFAAVQEVPMVLVVDGAVRKPFDSGTASVVERASAYGFAAHEISGIDARAVEKVVWCAVEEARSGGGLQVVEVSPPREDPIDRLIEVVVAGDGLTREEAAEMVATAEAEMSDALRAVEAEADPEPIAVLGPATAETELRRWARPESNR